MEEKIKPLHNLTTHSNDGQGCDEVQLIHLLCAFACKTGIRRRIFNLVLYQGHLLQSLNTCWNLIFLGSVMFPWAPDSLSEPCPVRLEWLLDSEQRLPWNLWHFSAALKSIFPLFLNHTKPTHSGGGTNLLFKAATTWCLCKMFQSFVSSRFTCDEGSVSLCLQRWCSPFYLSLWASSLLTWHNHPPPSPPASSVHLYF